MQMNIKSIFLVATILILLAGVTATSATEISDDTTVLSDADDTIAADVATPTVSDNKVMDTSKNIKKEPKTHIVNNDTITSVFSKEGTSPYAGYGFNSSLLGDDINDGDTIDIQGTITGNYNLTINKAVNIISSTHDAIINLNTSCTNLVGTDPSNHFIIGNEGSYTNITGINFYNTQIFVVNSTHVTFDHINATVKGNRLGGGVGQTSIRENSSYITVKNSYFYTENNGGSSTLVLAWANYCDIINNTINAGEGAGNLFYFTTFNVDIPENEEYNSYNKVINNTIGEKGYSYGGIQYCCSLMGKENIIKGNYIAGSVMFQSALYITQNTTFRNNVIDGSIPCGNNNIVENNTCKSVTLTGNNIQILNNNLSDSIKLRATNENITIKNNTCSLELNKYSNAVISENNIINLTIKKNTLNVTIENCNISGTITIDKGASKNTIQNNYITADITINGEENTIINNNITNINTYAINGAGTNNIITKNHILSTNLYGDNSVNLNKDTNTIENNYPKIELNIDTTTFTPGETTTIQASIYFDGEIITNITAGKITFKVNGKTLKDTSGKVIYAKVVNGVATIENYVVPDDWAKEGTTIQAVYSGSTQCEKLTSEKTNITVEKAAPTFTTESITATAGTTIQLKATITDGDKVINSGKVVFKINGKTVKDTNGKVIYAKVVNNQVIVNYTLPADMKVKDYNITATFISSDYERLEDTKVLSVTA